MLTTTRAQVEEYLRLYGLPHVEDSSNRDESFFPQPPALAGGAGAGGHVPRLRQTDGGDRSPAADRRGLPHRPGGKGGGGLPPRAGTLRLPAAAVGDLPDALAPRAARLLLALLRDGDADLAAPHLGGWWP